MNPKNDINWIKAVRYICCVLILKHYWNKMLHPD